MLKSGLLLAATCATLAAAGPAAAQSYAVSSKGTALQANVTAGAFGLGGSVTAGPLAVSQGQGPASYARSASVAEASGSVTLAALPPLTRTDLAFDGGLLTSSVAGGAGSATATAGIADFSLALEQVTSRLFRPDQVTTILGLSTGAIRSTASVDALTGAFSGSSSIAGLSISTILGPIGAGLTGNVTAAANSVLLDAVGVRIVLNEQITSGNLFTVNALSISFDNYVSGLLAPVNGRIVLGQSQVERIAVVPPAVPEPATWAMMIGGFGLVGAAMRRRSRVQAVAV